MQDVDSNAHPQLVPGEAAPPKAYYPSEVLAIFDAAIARQQRPLVSVRGIYRIRGKQAFNGYFYDAVSDRDSSQEITIRMPVTLREGLNDGDPVELSGVLLRKIDAKGFIQITLSVTRIAADPKGGSSPRESSLDRIAVERRRAVEAKREKGYKAADRALVMSLLSGAKPKVSIIYAAGSITDSDLLAGLGDAASAYDIQETRCNFAEKEQLVGSLRRADATDCDLLCIVRGGGQGLEAVDAPEVLAEAAQVNTPLACALGHVEDRLAFKMIADKVCPTPNGLGAWLKGIKDDADRMRAMLAPAREEKGPTKAQLKGQLEEAERKYAERCRENEAAVKAARERAALLEGEIEILKRKQAELEDDSLLVRNTALEHENDSLKEEVKCLQEKIQGNEEAPQEKKWEIPGWVVLTSIAVIAIIIILVWIC